MSINGVNGSNPAVSIADTSEAVPATTAASAYKTLYGDTSRAEGLMNTMNIMKQLSVSAQTLVSSRNTSFQ